MCFIHFQLESVYVWLLHKYVLLYIHVHFILHLLFCYQKYLHEKLQSADCFHCLSSLMYWYFIFAEEVRAQQAAVNELAARLSTAEETAEHPGETGV